MPKSKFQIFLDQYDHVILESQIFINCV